MNEKIREKYENETRENYAFQIIAHLTDEYKNVKLRWPKVMKTNDLSRQL